MCRWRFRLLMWMRERLQRSSRYRASRSRVIKLLAGILSVVTASRSEAVAESKDPYRSGSCSSFD